MSLKTRVLLRLGASELSAVDGLRLHELQDAVLVDTDVDFAAEPAVLRAALETALGEGLAGHDDPRGVFCIPSVVEITRDAYLDVLEEVGEGGQWVSVATSAEGVGHGVADGMGALSAVLSSVMQHMPEAMVEAAGAAARGDLPGVSAVADQVASLMGSPVQAQGLEALVARMGGGELDLSSPAFQKLLEAVQAQMDDNPALVAQLRAQLFGAGSDDGEGDA